MPDVLKERSEMDPRYQWDLSTLYADDDAWEAAFAAIDSKLGDVPAMQGTLNTAENIRRYLEVSYAVEREIENLFCYASLRRSEDTRAEKAQSMIARAHSKLVQYFARVAWAEPEILALPEDQLQALVEDPLLADYKFILTKLLRRQPHTLSAAEEQLLAGLGEVFGAPRDISSSLMDADMVFDPVTDAEGQSHELSGSNYILLQSSDDRTLRENAFRSFYKSYRQHSNTLAAAYSGAVKGAVAEARARHYESSRAMSLAGAHIPISVYDNLVETVHKHMPAMYRYVALRKKLLKLPELHYYDVYAPLVKGSEKQYSYEDAQELVLNAVAPLGENYVNVVRGAFRDNWIDVYPNKGKRGGAFSSGTYDSNPYILTNFTGTLDSVSTIAHEMGHSLHSWHSHQNQPYHYAGYTLFVAEVASTVNENLLIEQLLAKTSDPAERLVLLNQYLENFKGTVYRQTMFAEFEREAHAMAERGEALSPSALNALYKRLILEYFGPDMVWDDEVAYEWSRIPHFYRPFYVYVYATGYSTAVALSEGILREGEPAVKRYLEFLSMGGSQDPLDELRHAGVDLDTPAPIDTALDKFERVLADAEETARKLLGE
ncbi:MAG: oligoendopeptidase F [Firmicutes bacterium]|nr:oligoendopeptidase F [Bacillota bacterium]